VPQNTLVHCLVYEQNIVGCTLRGTYAILHFLIATQTISYQHFSIWHFFIDDIFTECVSHMTSSFSVMVPEFLRPKVFLKSFDRQIAVLVSHAIQKTSASLQLSWLSIFTERADMLARY